MQYGKQPLARIVALSPLVEARQGSLQCVLDQIVGLTAVAEEGARITPQAWDFCRDGFPARGHAPFLSYWPATSRNYDSRRRRPAIYSTAAIKIKCGPRR